MTQDELKERVAALEKEREVLIKTKHDQLERQAGLIGRQQRKINDLMVLLQDVWDEAIVSEADENALLDIRVLNQVEIALKDH